MKKKQKLGFAELLHRRTRLYFRRKKKTGFTMIEVLVVVTILAIATTTGIVTMQGTQLNSRDARRKSDLEKIKVALEDYYNDNQCYPAAGSLDVCGDSNLDPYLKEIPCDPRTKNAYGYLPEPDACKGYRVYAGLENTDDEAITNLGCGGADGCGYGTGFNYGISSGVPVYYE